MRNNSRTSRESHNFLASISNLKKFSPLVTTYTVFENHSKCLIWIFLIWPFFSNFCPIKIYLFGNTVWPQASNETFCVIFKHRVYTWMSCAGQWWLNKSEKWAGEIGGKKIKKNSPLFRTNAMFLSERRERGIWPLPLKLSSEFPCKPILVVSNR